MLEYFLNELFLKILEKFPEKQLVQNHILRISLILVNFVIKKIKKKIINFKYKG